MSCTGSGPAATPRRFLEPPYHGWTSIVSYFDHDSPNFFQDGLVITATGVEARVDPEHRASDFPAYWSSPLRQYIYYDGHNGYDYNLWYQPVYAAATGKIVFAALEYPTGPTHGYGNMVIIRHRHRYFTLYGHLSKILVKKGEHVRRGQRIGISGNTGHSTGPHLHFTVFHNCSPTDPYGWSGSGPDPLSGYQGETSAYLWKVQPDVVNPQRQWPDLGSLPTPVQERILLLALPSASRGTHAFTAALKREAQTVVDHLHGPGVRARIDLLNGAVLVDGPVSGRAAYAVPGVVSISSPDTLEGAKSDVLAALARAARFTPRPTVALSKSHAWKGYLMRWQGRALLVGTGVKGRRVELKVSSGKGGSTTKDVVADSSTGAYAIDLGKLSRSAYQRLGRDLKSAHAPRVQAHPVAPAPSTHHAAKPSPPGNDSHLWPFWLLLAALVLALAAASRFAPWQRLAAVSRRRPGGE